MPKTTVVVWSTEKAYFFRGKEYVRYDVDADRVDEGYPLPIADSWPGVFDGDIDAAVVWPSGKAYFFRGDEYIRYDVEADRVDEGFPLPIADSWPGVFDGDIDAAVVWPGGKAYFFRGTEYVRYDVDADRVDEGYPLPIADSWPGVFDGDIDAAVVWPSGKAYFFRGDEYIRYDVEADQVSEGYPLPVAGNWTGLPMGSSGGAPPATPGRTVRGFFPEFTTRFEGRVAWMYLDIKGLVTIGVGNLIDPKSMALGLPFVHKSGKTLATTEEIAAEWQLVKSHTELAQKGHRAAEPLGRLELTPDGIDQLVGAKFDANEALLRRTFPEWDGWPADARLGVHSMAWALGAGFPSTWKKFTAAAKARDWTIAGAECRISEAGNPGVRPRNEADLQMFTNAAKADAEGLDKATLYYPGRP